MHYTLVLSAEMNYHVELCLSFAMAVPGSQAAAKSGLPVFVSSRLSPVLNVVNV